MEHTVQRAAVPQGVEGVDEARLVVRLQEGYARLKQQIHRVIVGQDAVIDSLLCCMLAGGHCIVQGVPGLGKTLTVQAIAQAMKLRFSRIQFTPDLMPSDILGADIIQRDPQTQQRKYEFLKGPIFGHVVLADEINRTPPKTQAALLQAMQEKEVTVSGKTYGLEAPFFVLATQNPVEQEGTYPLPEAALDRFMFMVFMDYPSIKEEHLIVKQTTADRSVPVDAVLERQDMLLFQHVVRRAPVSDTVIAYAVRLARATRPDDALATDMVEKYVKWGAGPRAGQYMTLGAKARALIQGRLACGFEDIRAVCKLVLRHRIITNFSAEADGVRLDQILDDLLERDTPSLRRDMEDLRTVLDPRFLDRLADIELVARRVVEGFFAGLHPSPFHGFSVEYSDHRQYHPGDELKFVDWKIYGRTDKLYIKQFQQETNARVCLVLDSSASMGFQGSGAVSKMDYARFLAAALCYLMLRQGDCVSLASFGQAIREQVPPSSRRTHLHAVLAALQRATPGGPTNLGEVLHTLAETAARRGLVIVISDWLADEQEIFQGLAHLRFLGHEIVAFQVLDPTEMNLDCEGPIQFEDMESDLVVRADPSDLRHRYQAGMREFLNRVETTLGHQEIDYCLCDTSQPLDSGLMAYLAKRSRMK